MRCEGITATGSRCSRNARPSSEYCAQHANNPVTADLDEMVGRAVDLLVKATHFEGRLDSRRWIPSARSEELMRETYARLLARAGGGCRG